MKKILLLIPALLLISSCKETAKSTDVPKEEMLSVPEKIARAHGIANWNQVEELRFTFNVDRDTSHFERHWMWKPQTNEVTGISMGDTIRYNRNAVDSTALEADAAFVNDKYWLLAPFNLRWDAASFTFEQQDSVQAPISKKPMGKLTISYKDEGGYTPGDAYDFFYDEDYKIAEWIFRKGSQVEPSMITSWEDYSDFNGLLISRMHKKDQEDFKLYFTEIVVNTKN